MTKLSDECETGCAISAKEIQHPDAPKFCALSCIMLSSFSFVFVCEFCETTAEQSSRPRPRKMHDEHTGQRTGSTSRSLSCRDRRVSTSRWKCSFLRMTFTTYISGQTRHTVVSIHCQVYACVCTRAYQWQWMTSIVQKFTIDISSANVDLQINHGCIYA